MAHHGRRRRRTLRTSDRRTVLLAAAPTAAVNQISKRVAVQRLVGRTVGNGVERLLRPPGPLRGVIPDRIRRTSPVPPGTPP
jgi:hypothetical protein